MPAENPAAAGGACGEGQANFWVYKKHEVDMEHDLQFINYVASPIQVSKTPQYQISICVPS